MTPSDALAAAIRERLTSGRPAPLPGLGTLVRQHVSARVEERADGTRVLLPPGETIGLAPTDDSHETLAPTFGRLLALPDREVPQAYAEAADQLEARLAATGEVRLPGVGLLRRTSGGVILGVEADLLAAVNRAYEGLSPVGPSRSTDEAPAPSAPPASDPVDAPSDASDPRANASEDDPFMVGLPPVDAPDSLPPETGESARADAIDDDAFDLPVTADASDFGFAPAAAPSDIPEGSVADGPPASPSSSTPDDDTLETPSDLDDEPLPEPFDPGDLSTEPMLASDLAPLTTEPPEPEEPFVDTPDDATAPDPTDDVQEGAFVDDDTLDADLDDVLAVPFGRPEDESVAEVLPPSSPGDEVDDAPPEAQAPDADEDDWMAETWTAAGTAPPPVGLDDGDAFEIEDAEVIEDAPSVDDPHEASHPTPTSEVSADPAFAPPSEVEAPLDTPHDETADAPPASPDQEFEALLASPPPAEPPPVIVSDEPPTVATPDPVAEPTAAAPRRSWGWLVALVVLAAVVAAALWLWPRLSDRDADPDVVTEAPETLVAVPPVQTPPAPADDEPADSLATASAAASAPTAEAEPALDPSTPTTEAAPAASAGGRAFAGPRLEGLDEGDRRALTGPPIDPSMGGWTLVVASLRSEEAATDLMDRYRAAGYRTAVFPPSGRTVTRYRVGVGQFGSRDQARRLLDRVFEYEPGGTWPLNLRTL